MHLTYQIDHNFITYSNMQLPHANEFLNLNLIVKCKSSVSYSNFGNSYLEFYKSENCKQYVKMLS